MFRHPTSYLPSYLLRQASLWLHDVFNARASLRLMLLPIAGLCWLCVWYVLALMAAVDFILKATRLLISTAITEFILRPRRLVSMALCYVLVAAFLAPLVTANSRSSPVNAQGQTRHGTPVGGPPAADLPNLDEVRRKRHAKPQAPPHVPSLMRGRRKPLVPRRGLKVGDPGTMGAQASPPAGANERADRMSALQRTKRHHRRASTSTAPMPVGDDTYVQTFFSYALPSNTSQSQRDYFTDMLRAAYVHGQPSMVMAAREMGMTLFESAEYAARNRSNHDYVYDLYKTYLLREPDSGGWAFWESLVPGYGREAIRRAFDECGEFIYDVSTVTPNGSAGSNVTSLLAARVDPKNQSGSGLLGRDAGWGTTLLSLPGRAGLDLGLGISYSSAAVYTRSGPWIYFDADNSSLSPGFRIGFPTVQELFFDAQISQNAYLLITSAGSRVELRQVGSTNIYEAADSSYLQLTDNGSSLLLRSTDGTQMSYSKIEDEWRCTQIKDRNGNFITVNYNSVGDITTIVDTLNRTITFNYDTNANLISIAQSWNGVSRNWATFGWGTTTIAPNFSGVALSGIANNQSISVLTQVGLDDSSRYNFEYTSAGQVSMIRRYTSDNVERSHTAFDYGATDDSTRLTQTRVAADNWTGINGVPAEVTTTYGTDGSSACWATAPDGTVFKEFYGLSNIPWQKRLVTQTEVWSGGVKQKWTTTNWTHDGDANAGYPTNPRVTETNIYDASNNRRRATIDYTSFGLPSNAYEYAADATSVLRRTHTDYNLDSTYLNRRIIGLASTKSVFDGNNNLVSKVDLFYDEAGSVQNQGSPVQHDDANYGSGLVAGRANLSSARHYDVTNTSQYLSSSVSYNTAGSMISTTDPLGHTSTISYTDSFSDSVNHNTLAYPTTLTDADGYQSSVQYNFDFGAKTRVQGPPPANQSQGVIQTFTYDDAARIQRVTTANNGAYKRYYYAATYIESWWSVNNVADEGYANQHFDGLGRVIAAASIHPGSSGGYSGQLIVYDAMGRAVKQSNPTEIGSNWVPTGDDAAGWLYTQQTYDWKGRPLVTTNTYDTTKEAIYGGCGCAGGEVVVTRDEVGRRQKTIFDPLGRPWKNQILYQQDKSQALNGDGDIYSTAVNTYNARDQVTLVRQYQGADTSGVYQETTATFDGYGRLKTKHVPEQNAGTNTTWDYNNDDTIQKVTDARGASATYSYNNNRHLVTGITYTAPSGVAATPNVSFSYDAAGNNTFVSDGIGTVSFGYDQLSRLASETRHFNDLANTSTGGNYTLSYGYNLGSELTSITDQSIGTTVNYAFDSTGRLSAVNGSGFPNFSTFASNFQYRAWGAIKDFDYGNGVHQHVGFNNRLQLTSSTFSNVHVGANQSATISKTYDYYADGRNWHAYNGSDARFDRAYTYDHAGRILDALSGSEARGGTTADGPYKQHFSYDAWSNMINRTSRLWTQDNSESASYTNNRRQYWGYDAEGHATATVGDSYGYDVTAKPTSYAAGWIGDQRGLEVATSYEGSGAPAKQVETTREVFYDENGDPQVTTDETTNYYLRSTALGGKVIGELAPNGARMKNHLYAGGMELAQPYVYQNTTYVNWQHTDPVTGSSFTTDTTRTFASQKELGMLGEDVTTPPPPRPTMPAFWQSQWPVEAAWGGPSAYYEQGNAWWQGQMDIVAAQNFVDTKAYAFAAMLIHKNPSLFIMTVDATGRKAVDLVEQLASLGLHLDKAGELHVTFWGEAAAAFLEGYGEWQQKKESKPQKPDKRTTLGVVFTIAVIRDSIRDEAEITVADFAANFDDSSYAATFEFGSDSKVCQGKPFSMSVKFKTDSSVRLRSGKDPGNRMGPGRDSQFKGEGGLVSGENPPYFFIRLLRDHPDNPGRTITVTAAGDNQFGPVSARAFVRINCP